MYECSVSISVSNALIINREIKTWARFVWVCGMSKCSGRFTLGWRDTWNSLCTFIRRRIQKSTPLLLPFLEQTGSQPINYYVIFHGFFLDTKLEQCRLQNMESSFYGQCQSFTLFKFDLLAEKWNEELFELIERCFIHTIQKRK